MDVKASPETVDTTEILSCVAGTDHRIGIITALADDELDLRDLSDELGVPRTTLRHNLEQLQEHDIVDETLDRTYALTTLGQATLSGLDAFRSRVETEARLAPLFSCIHPSTFEFAPTALEDADITVAERPFPHRPGQRLLDAIQDGQSVTAVLPSVPPLDSDDLEKLATRDDCSLNLTLTVQVTEVVRQQFPTTLSKLADHERHTIRVTSADIPYGLAVIDGQTFVQGFDDDGKPHVLVETTNQCCREWAETEMESYSSEATRLAERTA